MHTFKNALCLIGILIAYGIAGHLDFDDAQMQEAALAKDIVASSNSDDLRPMSLGEAVAPPWSHRLVTSQTETEPPSTMEFGTTLPPKQN